MRLSDTVDFVAVSMPGCLFVWYRHQDRTKLN
jgi:hypothetical protein